MKISTAQEAINGNSNDTVITPLRLKQVLNSKNIGGGGSSGGITKETDPIFKASPAAKITDENIENWSNKQDPLVSGQNIKTINGQDILGEGNIVIEGGSSSGTPEVSVGGGTPTSGEKVWFQTIGNLFNINTIVDGGRLSSSGNVLTWFNDCCCSDFIEVQPNTQYTLSGGTKNSGVAIPYYNCYYDENKNFISSFLVASGTQTITTPANAKYMRFTVYNVDKDKFQFEKGSVATSYKPYSNKQSINILSDGNYKEFLNVDNLLIKDDNILVEETDPTVPAHVKTITQEDIDNWNTTRDTVPINSIFEYEGDDIPDGYAEVIGESEDGTMGGLVDTYDLLQFVYPVGSIFISNTNVDPATFMGGQWELVDKHFKEWSYYSSNTDDMEEFVTPHSNATPYAFGIVRSEHSVYIRYYFRNQVQLSDTETRIGYLKFEKFGIKNELYLGIYDISAGSENGIALMNVSASTGEIYCSDVVTKGGTTIATNTQIRFEVEARMPKEYMLDAHCDKFFWKRLS